MATPCSFSSSGEEAIQRELEGVSLSEKEEKTEEDIRKYYEIDRCLEFVSTHENVSFIAVTRLSRDFSGSPPISRPPATGLSYCRANYTTRKQKRCVYIG